MIVMRVKQAGQAGQAQRREGAECAMEPGGRHNALCEIVKRGLGSSSPDVRWWPQRWQVSPVWSDPLVPAAQQARHVLKQTLPYGSQADGGGVMRNSQEMCDGDQVARVLGGKPLQQELFEPGKPDKQEHEPQEIWRKGT